jgi:hypothetical protein
VATLARLEQNLPATLRDFSRRVRAQLSELETEILKAGSAARRSGTSLLREASHALGRYETYGEARWRRLAAPARREALKVLRRLERALEGSPKKKAGRKRRAARPSRPRRPTAVPETAQVSLPPGM